MHLEIKGMMTIKLYKIIPVQMFKKGEIIDKQPPTISFRMFDNTEVQQRCLTSKEWCKPFSSSLPSTYNMYNVQYYFKNSPIDCQKTGVFFSTFLTLNINCSYRVSKKTYPILGAILMSLSANPTIAPKSG